MDGEGDTGERGLLGCALWSDHVHSYLTDHAAILDQLTDHAERGYTFVAHNASYDLSVVFWQLGVSMRAVYYNSTFTHGEWKYSPKRPAAQLWDSFNLSGNLSLARLGEAIGLPKYKTPQSLGTEDFSQYNWKCEEHGTWECVECYALRDAEIVYRYMLSYADVLASWGVRPHRRIAGAAVDVWKALDRPVPIRIADSRIRHLARQSYYGGRVECFKLGSIAPIYTADVASMYPSVMLETAQPDPSCMVYAVDPPLSRFDWTREGVAECTVRVPACYVPPLPNKRHSERVFAVGLQRGTWTLLELRHAIRMGCDVLRIHKAGYSLGSLHPFTLFVGVLWELRNEYKKRNDPRAQTVKVLLNSCYGRLGLRGDVKREHIEVWGQGKQMRDYPGGHPYTAAGRPFVRYPVKMGYEQEWINVLWAAQITAAARVKLHWHLIAQGDALVYCDTDSVFSSRPIVGLADGLGGLTDHTPYSGAEIYGPKLYALLQSTGETQYRAKGVPRRFAERYLAGLPVTFDSPISPKAQARRGVAAGTWVQITRERQLVPARRVPTNPAALDTPHGTSDTLPPWIGPSGV